jgi:beta-lactam-binding protein with PASTA domain
MPDVIGMTERDARNKFKPLPNPLSFPRGAKPGNKVILQVPPAGAKLLPQDQVELTIGAPGQ